MKPAHISHGRAWIWVALLAVILAAIASYTDDPAAAGQPVSVATASIHTLSPPV